MFQFIKTTALGGIIFLIPVIILVAVFTKGYQLVSKIVAPLLAIVPVDRIFGIVILDLLILALGVLICFLAGLAAKSYVAVRLVTSLESNFLSKIPAYDVQKTKLASRMRFEEGEETQPVLIRFDDQWQIGFEVDRVASGKVTVYLPGAPDPWSGSVSIVTEDRITHLDLKQNAALGIFKQLGKGAGDQLKESTKKS